MLYATGKGIGFGVILSDMHFISFGFTIELLFRAENYLLSYESKSQLFFRLLIPYLLKFMKIKTEWEDFVEL
jgi:hypothetical protein